MNKGDGEKGDMVEHAVVMLMKNSLASDFIWKVHIGNI